MGPAAYTRLLVEAGKYLPLAGTSARLDFDYAQHRYSRARLALASEKLISPTKPARYRAVRCALRILEQTRIFLAGEQGPTVVVDNIVDFKDLELMTYRYEVDPKVAVSHPEYDATVIHGTGALYLSHGGATAPIVRNLSNPQDRRFKLVSKVLKSEKMVPIRINAKTFDLPIPGNFLGHFEFDSTTRAKWGSPRAVGETLGTYLTRRRALHGGRQSIGFGFSAGAAIVGMPELYDHFDALVMVGPVIPGKEAKYNHSRERLFDLAGTLFIPNWEAFYWADTVISAMNWGDRKTPFPNPALILVGENDTDVSESTIEWLEFQASRFSHVNFHRIKDAGHNVSRGRPILDENGNKIRDYDPTEAFAIVHRFLHQYKGARRI